MKIRRFDEGKKDNSDKDISAKPFDVDSMKIDKEVVGFRSELDEVKEKDVKKIKKEIQSDGNTPGLKKAIKKFEEFTIEISIGEEEPEEECCEACDQVVSQCVCGDGSIEDSCECCGETPCQCGPDCDCKCGQDEEIVRFSDMEEPSDDLAYHLMGGLPVTENVFRPGSKKFFSVLKEARNLSDSGKIKLKGIDRELFEGTDIGRFAEYEGNMVALDVPMEIEEEINEAEYHGDKVKLNHPMRAKGGKKKYYVYVMNPKTHKVKKVTFGDVHGGLTAKVSNAEARKKFAARHDCKNKKDKTKAGYWACRINKYAHLWSSNRSYPGYW
jgi:hypothetical protein